VAWTEWDGTDVMPNDFKVWVSRLSEDGTAWESVGGPAPVNDGCKGSSVVDLATVDDVPYLAWGACGEVHVSRLDAAGTGWEPVGGVVNHAAAANAYGPSLAVIDGVLHVAWIEWDVPAPGVALNADAASAGSTREPSRGRRSSAERARSTTRPTRTQRACA
jgi:hypothetical protein